MRRHRRTTSAPPGRITRQGMTPKPASAAPSHHSNAPIRQESQSILSKILVTYCGVMLLPGTRGGPSRPHQADIGSTMAVGEDHRVAQDAHELVFVDQAHASPVVGHAPTPQLVQLLALDRSDVVFLEQDLDAVGGQVGERPCMARGESQVPREPIWLRRCFIAM